MRRSCVSAAVSAVTAALAGGLAAGAATTSSETTPQIVFAANRSPMVNGRSTGSTPTGSVST
jgi:hypothetical protein